MIVLENGRGFPPFFLALKKNIYEIKNVCILILDGNNGILNVLSVLLFDTGY
jgi:hypothetical protein